jgi:dTDP-4-amino-4,6-dideoxygalactose transaminase
VGLLDEMNYGSPVYHIFPVFSRHRDQLQKHLTASGVATGIHYPIPAHLQQAFADLEVEAGSLPVTERASNETLSLPMFAELSEEDVAAVARAVKQFQA